MNKHIIVAVIIAVILGAGGYFYFNSQRGTTPTGQGHVMEDTSGNTVVQSHRSYEIEVLSKTENIQSKQRTTIRYRIKNDKGEILKNYEVAHEKIMHFILVRHDLQYFQHIHPDYNEASGEFTVTVTFPTDGPYRIFPDFTPGDDNPQKLPVTVFSDVDVGDETKYSAQPVAADTQTKKTVEDYQISFTVPKIKAQEEFTYGLEINKNGQPVTDLEKYLGALGHSVILKAGTLDFIHTHAQEAKDASATPGHNMGAMQKDTSATERGSKINFATSFPEPGVYKVFTQFQHEGKVQIVDYVVKIN